VCVCVRVCECVCVCVCVWREESTYEKTHGKLYECYIVSLLLMHVNISCKFKIADLYYVIHCMVSFNHII